MNTVLHEEEGHVTAVKMKQKLMNDVKEESRSFLSFSRENLGILHTDLDCSHNRSQLRSKMNTVLSALALITALLCLGLEAWKLRCTLTNSRNIEDLKRDVQILKHRLMEEDLLEELKAFEEQVYAEEINDEDDPSELDIDNADYDTDYENEEELVEEEEDSDKASSSYSGDYGTPLLYGSRPSDFAKNLDTTDSISNLNAFLLPSHNVETKNRKDDDDLEKKQRAIDERLLKDAVIIAQKMNGNKNTERVLETKFNRDVKMDQVNRTKQKRAVIQQKIEPIRVEENKDKEESETSNPRRIRKPLSQSRRRINIVKFENDESSVKPNRSFPLDKHPPKKYHSHDRSEGIRESPLSHDDDSKDSIMGPQEELTSRRDIGQRRNNWRDHRAAEFVSEDIHRVSNQSSEEKLESAMKRGVRIAKRNLRAPRQVYAIHYGADSTMFTSEDEHTGNGRARHNEGVFKAWRPSDWVIDLGMNRFFTLANDGRLTVREAGLYLTYAQIHYLDEHDENGFHLLVNGRPILQCMVYSPGTGHKSRSCFSAQVTLLQAGDHLVLKDVGPARYTLFQHDKSFFGLVKLGESRQVQSQPQRHQSQPL